MANVSAEEDPQLPSLGSSISGDGSSTPSRSLDDLSLEVQELFERHIQIDALLSISRKLQSQLKESLRSSSQCMLPSHFYHLPSGKEKGVYLALAVGGSNLQVALVELKGQDVTGERLQVRQMDISPIEASSKDLDGPAFFDWIAQKIQVVLEQDEYTRNSITSTEPLRLGIAWAFPLDQASARSGNVMGMGKGFRWPVETQAKDLGEIIEQACRRFHLNVRLDAILNDSCAALLFGAYVNPPTRLAMILGTGVNAALRLPISSLEPSKFGPRIMPNPADATHVLVNTELSMFGKDVFPTTRWDEQLNRRHELPDFQPLEYLVAGRYMGEIVRLILVEGAAAAGLFGGLLPLSLADQYSLDTRTLAAIQFDRSPSLSLSCQLFHERHPSSQPPSHSDMDFIRHAIGSVSHRSSAYVTASVHALSTLLDDLEGDGVLQGALDPQHVGCDGSVINKFPEYMDRSQEMMDQMLALEANGRRKRLVLGKTINSTLLGAGIACTLAAVGSFGLEAQGPTP